MTHIYCLTTDTYPGKVKIGRTTDIAARLASLGRASMLLHPPRLEWTFQVEDSIAAEAALHAAMAHVRTSPHREFFDATPEEARELFLSLGIAYHVEPLPDPLSFDTLMSIQGDPGWLIEQITGRLRMLLDEGDTERAADLALRGVEWMNWLHQILPAETVEAFYEQYRRAVPLGDEDGEQ